MLSFLAKPTPRTRTSHQNPVTYTTTGSAPVTLTFSPFPSSTLEEQLPTSSPPILPPPGGLAMRISIPPGPSLALPPPHWHRKQTESFTCIRGRFMGYTSPTGDLSSPTAARILQPGETIAIPAGLFHRFENAADPGSGEEGRCVVDVYLDPLSAKRDEAFFRNFYGYLEDCNRVAEGQGKGREKGEPSVFQLMLFLYEADTVVAVPGLPVWLGKAIGLAMEFVTGKVVGEWLLGYRSSYEEYFDEREWSVKRR